MHFYTAIDRNFTGGVPLSLLRKTKVSMLS